MLYAEITNLIIKSFYEVYKHLGNGFLESVYEKALIDELKNAGLETETQKHLKVRYKKTIVGDFIADIVVENKIIVEVKATSSINKNHEAQLINYLKATGFKLGLLLNFGEKPEFIRRVF